jgi:hypothetical protein
MLIELITPIMLASAPMTIVVPEGNYDHGSQVSTYKGLTKLALTMNGTQTYGADGHPRDADNDN